MDRAALDVADLARLEALELGEWSSARVVPANEFVFTVTAAHADIAPDQPGYFIAAASTELHIVDVAQVRIRHAGVLCADRASATQPAPFAVLLMRGPPHSGAI